MKELNIEVPEGYEIDRENSSFECIKFKKIKKDLPKKWSDLKTIRGFFIEENSDIQDTIDLSPYIWHSNVFSTIEIAKAALAIAQLSQLRDVYRDRWEPDWTSDSFKYVIVFNKGIVGVNIYQHYEVFLSFQSSKIRDEFLKNFKNLIIEAQPILGGN